MSSYSMKIVYYSRLFDAPRRIYIRGILGLSQKFLPIHPLPVVNFRRVWCGIGIGVPHKDRANFVFHDAVFVGKPVAIWRDKSNITTGDTQFVFESSSGCNLRRFIRPWVTADRVGPDAWKRFFTYRTFGDEELFFRVKKKQGKCPMQRSIFRVDFILRLCTQDVVLIINENN